MYDRAGRDMDFLRLSGSSEHPTPGWAVGLSPGVWNRLGEAVREPARRRQPRAAVPGRTAASACGAIPEPWPTLPPRLPSQSMPSRHPERASRRDRAWARHVSEGGEGTEFVNVPDDSHIGNSEALRRLHREQSVLVSRPQDRLEALGWTGDAERLDQVSLQRFPEAVVASPETLND